MAGHVVLQQGFSEIVFQTKIQERHKRCVSMILEPFPNIIIIKVISLSILEMKVYLKDRSKTLMDMEREYTPNRFWSAYIPTRLIYHCLNMIVFETESCLVSCFIYIFVYTCCPLTHGKRTKEEDSEVLFYPRSSPKPGYSASCVSALTTDLCWTSTDPWQNFLLYYSIKTSVRSERMRPSRTTHWTCHSHPSLFT